MSERTHLTKSVTALDRAIHWASMADRQVEKDVGDYRAAAALAQMWAAVAQADAGDGYLLSRGYRPTDIDIEKGVKL